METKLEDLSPEMRDQWAEYGLARVRHDETVKAEKEARAAAHAEWLAKVRRLAGQRGAARRWGKDRPKTVKVRMFREDAEELGRMARILRRHGQPVTLADMIHAVIHAPKGPEEADAGTGAAIGGDSGNKQLPGTRATHAPTPAGGQP